MPTNIGLCGNKKKQAGTDWIDGSAGFGSIRHLPMRGFPLLGAKLWPILGEGEEMYAYCLFCNTAKCPQIALLLQELICCRAFSPTIIQRKWVKGKCLEEEHPYLPGYVFLFTEERLLEYRQLWAIPGVLRILGRKEDGFLLQGEDFLFAQAILDSQGTIGIQKAYAEGDRIRLVNSAFSGYTGQVVKADRRKGRAQVRVRFDEKEFLIWVGFELMESLPEEANEPSPGRKT